MPHARTVLLPTLTLLVLLGVGEHFVMRSRCAATPVGMCPRIYLCNLFSVPLYLCPEGVAIPAGTHFVLKINQGSPADGKMLPDDVLAEINGRDVSNASHEDTVNCVRHFPGALVDLSLPPLGCLNSRLVESQHPEAATLKPPPPPRAQGSNALFMRLRAC